MIRTAVQFGAAAVARARTFQLLRLLRQLLLGLAVLSAGTVFAQTDTATAETLLRKSGLWDQYTSVAAGVQAGVNATLARTGAKPSAAELERIAGVIQSAYSVTRLRASTLDVVTRRLNPANVAELTRWFDSALGRQVVQLEVAEAAEQGGDPQFRLQQGLALLEKLAPERKLALNEFLQQSKTAQTLTQVFIDTTLASWRGAASASPNTPAVSEAELTARLQAQRPQLLQMFTTTTLAGYAKMYAPLSLDQLQAYVAFMKTSAGHDFNAVSIEAFEAAMTGAATELGRNLQGAKDQANT